MIKRTVFYGVILLLMVIVIIFMYRAVKINSIPKQIGKVAYDANKGKTWE